MVKPVFSDIQKLPYFLQDYGKLMSHFQSEFEALGSKEKGDYFVDFTQRLVPNSEIGYMFERPNKSSKQSYDEGVDLSCDNKEGTERLFIQSKYTISDVDDFDTIMSKFETYETKLKTMTPARLIPDDNVPKHPMSRFMVVTSSDLHSRIINRYKNSQRPTLRFYNSLNSEGRIHVIDGPQLLEILKETYRKSYLLPSILSISSVCPFIQLENVYVGIISARELKELYDEFGNSLFLENIREYLGPTSGKIKSGQERITVNEAIVTTLLEDADKFLARNNGITFRASSVSIQDDKTLNLEDASIVNGCQTTISIVQHPQDNCHVLIKIVESSDSWDIAEAANFQNQIDQIVLKLAKYIRPQMIRSAASKFNVRLKSPEESSPYAVIDAIYQREITEEEFRALFLALFSSSPRNVLSINYTELNMDVIDRLFTETSQEKERAYEILFRIRQIIHEGAQKVEEALKEDIDLLNLFQRFWKEDKPNYRAFISTLAVCGCINSDIYEKGRPTYEIMIDFLKKLQSVIDRESEIFLRYFHLAFTVVALDFIRGDQTREETLQQMKSMIDNTSFHNLFLKLRTLATSANWLDKKKISGI